MGPKGFKINFPSFVWHVFLPYIKRKTLLDWSLLSKTRIRHIWTIKFQNSLNNFVRLLIRKSNALLFNYVYINIYLQLYIVGFYCVEWKPNKMSTKFIQVFHNNWLVLSLYLFLSLERELARRCRIITYSVFQLFLYWLFFTELIQIIIH